MSALSLRAAITRQRTPADRHTRPASRALYSTLGAALLLTVGCSSKAKPDRIPVFPVEGVVTFKGQAPMGAVVALHSKNQADAKAPTPRANVGPDGHFSITTYNRADGAPEGEYIITVLWYKPVKKGADTLPGPNVIPIKYTSPSTSDLVVKVAAGPNTLQPIAL